MRPNSKIYSTDFGSSFQKSAYRSFQTKPKPSDLERWNHAGFDQLQLEQQDKYSKFSRNRRNQPDNTMASDSLESSDRGRNLNQEKTRWTHDKYQETIEDFPPMKNKEETGPKEAAQESKGRKERRPDRQLYSVRQKYSMKNEEMKKMKEMTVQCSDRLNCSAIHKKEDSSPYLKGVKEVLKAFDEKEVHSIEDDRLSISNVSTAMSDRLRNWEEESYLKSEFLKDRVDSSDMTHSPKDKETAEVLFEIVLEGENGFNNVRIYQGEEDYEAQLDEVCNASSLDMRTALYFKINMMQMIVETGLGSEKTSATLNRLLDTNYRIIMCESGHWEADESIAQYMEKENKENESILGNLEDSY